MEVMPGYKQTEVGVIPDDWTIETLGELGKWLSGGTPSMSEKTYWDGSIPWVSPKDMKVARLHDASDHVSEKALTNGTRLAPQNALLMVVRGMILAHSFPVARAERALAFNQDIKALVVRDSIDSDYLLWWLQAHKSALLSITTESTHGTRRLPSETLFAQKIALPSLSEQKSIAEVLSNADALIEILEQLIAKKRLLKKGVMQKLLTGRRRLRGFANATIGYKQTEVGVIPEDWAVTPMAELFTFQNGVNADKAAYGKGIPFINVLEVITHSTLTETKIPGRISLSPQASSAFRVQTGDLLFNRTSETQEEVGLASVYTDNREVVFGGFVIRARPRDGSLDPMFSSYALRSSAIRRQIVSRGQGAVRANIGQQELSKVQVFVPSLPEQEAIAAILSAMDAEIALLEAQLAKYRQLKQGMMQKLLTGRIRLV